VAAGGRYETNAPGTLKDKVLVSRPAAPSPNLRPEQPANGSSLLPNHFQCKLNVSGLCRQVVHKSVGYYRSICVKDPRAIEWFRRHKVGVIEDVEDLRPELDAESLRNAMNREVLSRREIQVYKFGPNDGIAARIAKEIGASAGNAGLS
jgi:hypothetical protein